MIGVRVHVIAALLVSTLGCRRQASPEIHLIPAGYQGAVVILFDDHQPDDSREGNAIVYRVGAGGVGMAKGPPNEGVASASAFQHFYVTADGKRSPIPVFPLGQHDDELQVFDVRLGVSDCPRKVCSDGDPSVRWYAYVVGVPSRRKDWGAVMEHAVNDAVAAYFRGQTSIQAP